MLEISTCTAIDLPKHVAGQCRLLCHEGSDMQELFTRIWHGQAFPSETQWRVGYAWGVGPHGGVLVHGWVSITDWLRDDDEIPQLQGFVAPTSRGRGIATALCVCITHGMTREQMPRAVFSDEFFSIARRLGWSVTQYRHFDEGWRPVASRVDGTDIERGFVEE